MAIKIMIDAGHGGYDNGASYEGRKEKDDVLALAFAVGDILKGQGYDVVYTRTSDVYDSPVQKARIGNESGADFFVSLHRNSSATPNQYNGVQTLIYDDSGIKKTMAENINKQLEAVGYRNINVDIRPNLAVLRRTRMPAVLVEAGFINSDIDNALFDNNFNETARAIADGINETIRDAGLMTMSNRSMPAFSNNNTLNNDEQRKRDISSDNMYNDRRYMDDFSGNEMSVNGMPGNGMSENVMTGNGMPGNGMPGNGMPENGMPGNGMPGNGMPGNGMPGNGMPENGMPENGMPGNGMPGNGMPENGMPGNGMPGNGMPGNGMPENDMSGNGMNDMAEFYQILIGLYRSFGSATYQMNRLINDGYYASIYEDEGLYQVRVGQYNNIEDALIGQRELRDRGYDTLIVKGI